MTTLLEVVQTGDQYTAFILEDGSCCPEKVCTGPTEDSVRRLVVSIYPTAASVGVGQFIEEVQRRCLLNKRPPTES